MPGRQEQPRPMTPIFSSVFFLALWLLLTFYFPLFLCLFLGSEKFLADVTMKLTISCSCYQLAPFRNEKPVLCLCLIRAL